MALSYETVNQVINDAAVEVGLAPVADVFATTNAVFQQLRYLLNAAGRELLRMPGLTWAEHEKEFSIVTDAALDDGNYPLPDDWGYPIPSTFWNRTDDLPVFGPLSPQDWAQLQGSGISSQSMYASFRVHKGQMSIYPNSPVLDAKTLVIGYVRNTWLCNAAEDTFYSRVQQSTDIILYEPVLIVKFLALKFLEAKGFDSQRARDTFLDVLHSVSGTEKSAPILNIGGTRGFPYLGERNIPDSGYGA